MRIFLWNAQKLMSYTSNIAIFLVKIVTPSPVEKLSCWRVKKLGYIQSSPSDYAHVIQKLGFILIGIFSLLSLVWRNFRQLFMGVYKLNQLPYVNIHYKKIWMFYGPLSHVSALKFPQIRHRRLLAPSLEMKWGGNVLGQWAMKFEPRVSISLGEP